MQSDFIRAEKTIFARGDCAMEHLEDKEIEQILQQLEKGIFSAQDFTDAEMAQLCNLANNNQAWVRAQVAVLLINSCRHEAQAVLIQLIKDEDFLVRAEACDSLQNAKSSAAYDALLHAAKKDQSGMVRGYAISSLVSVSKTLHLCSETAQFLESLCLNRLATFTKINLYTALYLLGNRKYLPDLFSCMDSKRYQNRCAVVNCLREMMDKDNFDAMKKWAQQHLETERVIAVKSSLEKFLHEIALHEGV